jgi:hypothetical protein
VKGFLSGVLGTSAMANGSPVPVFRSQTFSCTGPEIPSYLSAVGIAIQRFTPVPSPSGSFCLVRIAQSNHSFLSRVAVEFFGVSLLMNSPDCQFESLVAVLVLVFPCASVAGLQSSPQFNSWVCKVTVTSAPILLLQIQPAIQSLRMSCLVLFCVSGYTKMRF